MTAHGEANGGPPGSRRRQPLLDLARLSAHTAGDGALAAELLALFAEQARAVLPVLAAGSADGAVAREVAHRLKGASASVGALRLAAAASALEAVLTQEGTNAEDTNAEATSSRADLLAIIARTLASVATALRRDPVLPAGQPQRTD